MNPPELPPPFPVSLCNITKCDQPSASFWVGAGAGEGLRQPDSFFSDKN